MSQSKLGPRTVAAAVRASLPEIENWISNGVKREEIAVELSQRYNIEVSLHSMAKALYRVRQEHNVSGLHNPESTGLHKPKGNLTSDTSTVKEAENKPEAESKIDIPADLKHTTLEDEGRSHFTQSDFSKIDEEAEKEMESVKQSKARKRGF